MIIETIEPSMVPEKLERLVLKNLQENFEYEPIFFY